MPINHANAFTDLTDSQYAALGKIVVEWANIEYLLGVLLSRLLLTPEYLGRTYAEGLTAARMQTAVSEAVAVHRHRYSATRIPETQLLEIEELNSRVSELRAERNRISHFCWSRWSDDEIFGTSLAGGVPDPKWERRNSKTLTIEDLQHLHRKAHSLTEELMRIVEALPEVFEG